MVELSRFMDDVDGNPNWEARGEWIRGLLGCGEMVVWEMDLLIC